MDDTRSHIDNLEILAKRISKMNNIKRILRSYIMLEEADRVRDLKLLNIDGKQKLNISLILGALNNSDNIFLDLEIEPELLDIILKYLEKKTDELDELLDQDITDLENDYNISNNETHK